MKILITFLLLYICNSIKLITNKVIDTKNINIFRYNINNSLFFIEFNDFIKKKNTFKHFSTNNDIYVYKIEKKSIYTIDFLITRFSVINSIPILTSKKKYFKPFQYSIYDILLYKYNDDKLVFKEQINKYSVHYMIDNNSKNIIRI